MHAQIEEVAARLEANLRDMVDIEIPIEPGRLQSLQCRAAQRSAQAALRLSSTTNARADQSGRGGRAGGR